MTRVLVTGATGFIGSHVLRALGATGDEVHVISRARPAAEGIEWHELDLLDAARVEETVRAIGPGRLLHAAWYAEHGSFWRARENLDWIGATLTLVRAFSESGGQRAVLVGTCAEYDWSSDDCCTGSPLAPATLYGAAKDATRRVVDAYARQTGLSAAWARLFFTFGPGEQETRVVASTARSLVAGRPAPCTDGVQVRDFLYVEDVADALVSLLSSDVAGAVDIGTGEGVPLRELLARLSARAGAAELLQLGAVPSRREPARIVADVTRLHQELHWRPSYTLDDALDRTLAYWRDRQDA